MYAAVSLYRRPPVPAGLLACSGVIDYPPLSVFAAQMPVFAVFPSRSFCVDAHMVAAIFLHSHVGLEHYITDNDQTFACTRYNSIPTKNIHQDLHASARDATIINTCSITLLSYKTISKR